MKKRYMIWKDIHSFFRDFRSFFLLFLTPVLITVLVGSLFMSSGVKDIPIVLCANQTNSIYNNTLSMMNSSDVFIIYQKIGDCNGYISERLKAGTVRAGIIVPEIEMGSTIEIYVDNTKPIGTYLQSYFNLISRDISNRLINTFISDAVLSMESSDYEISRIESAINAFDSDMVKVQNDIENARSHLSSMESSLNSMKTSASVIKSQTTAILASVSSARSLALELGYTEIISDLDVISSRAQSIEWEAGKIESAEFSGDAEGIRSSLDSMESILEELRDGMKTIKSNIDLIKTILSQIRKNMPVYSDPVKSRITSFFGEKSYINFIFPSILIMIVMWMATFLSSINFIRQKHRGILRRLYVSPMSTRSIAFEKIVSNTIISLIPLPFILFISFFILGIELSLLDSIFVFLAASLSVIVFAIAGLIIGSFSKTESTAILGSLIVIIPLMFMSGALYPVEAFPSAIKIATQFLPINTGIRLVEGFLFYRFDWIEFMLLVYTMLGYMFLLSGMCWLFMRRSLKS